MFNRNKKIVRIVSGVIILLLVLLIIEMVKDAIKKNKDGAYSLPPEQYEKKLKKEAEALEKENNEANNSK